MPEVLSTEARELFADYVRRPLEYWAGRPDAEFQSAKIDRALGSIRDRVGASAQDAPEYVLDLVNRRASGHPPTVYVGGRGGSGSNWLANMLHDLGTFANAGEVYLAQPLVRSLNRLEPRQQGLLVDAVHLLHALADRENAADQPIVNPRGSVHYLQLKAWEPGCFYVHLIRDPREQCMSTTYRKPDARNLYPVEGGSEEFLRLNVNFYRTSLLRVLTYALPPDAVVRYEELRSEPARILRELAGAVGIEVSPEKAAAVAFAHKAENIQVSDSRSNLYRGQRLGWRESTSLKERQVLHAGLSDVIDITGYPLDDCLGLHVGGPPRRSEVTVRLPEGVILGELHGRAAGSGTWTRLGHAAGTFVLPAGVDVRLRCPGGWTDGLAQLAHLPGDALSVLCLSANQDIDDEELVHLSTQRGLRKVDLSRTPITDAGLAHLHALPRLRGLNLLETKVTGEAVQAFADSRPQCLVVAGELWSEAWRPKRWLEDRFLP